ncbi:rod shape-determining protein RodA [Paenibacillaceae bacterium]|nr:rod shape-determining protein RodA [Paenibacillaceae bacterium]
MQLIQKIKNIDIPIFLILIGLVGFGTIAIYSATVGTKYEGMHITNLILFAVFCIPMLFVALFDYRILAGKFAWLLYGVGIVLLLLVMLTGEDINGSVRWLSIGGAQIQPSELAKLSTILLIGHLLHKREGENLRIVQDIVPMGILFSVPVLFILKQPDLGTSLVFVGILVGMIWIGNIRFLHMLIFIAVIAVAVGTVIWLYYGDYELLSRIVKPHQLSRIQVFLDPASDPDKSWHVNNAIIAISSGELSGEGFLQGSYIKSGYIPYAYSDSIFVVIGEDFGFVGSALLLFLYFLLIYRMILIAMDSKSLTGSYLVIGIVSMLVIQVFENIGMHIGLLPLTGIALPFISYGGSSMLTHMLAIGLVLSVKIHRYNDGTEPVKSVSMMRR